MSATDLATASQMTDSTLQMQLQEPHTAQLDSLLTELATTDITAAAADARHKKLHDAQQAALQEFCQCQAQRDAMFKSLHALVEEMRPARDRGEDLTPFWEQKFRPQVRA